MGRVAESAANGQLLAMRNAARAGVNWAVLTSSGMSAVGPGTATSPGSNPAAALYYMLGFFIL